jgi:DNA-binding FadR family transcriptional regulator
MSTHIGQNKAFLEIAEKIQKQIEQGQLQLGDRLPSERALAETYQTSRATVREALRALEITGVIESRVGQGTFIKNLIPSSSQRLFDEIANETSPSEVFEARFSIEPYLAELAAFRATQDNLVTLERNLVDTLGCLSQKEFTKETIYEFERLDGLFHYEISLVARNSFLMRMTDLINSVRMEKLWGTLKERSLNRERMKKYYQEHCDIFIAIKERDAKKAKILAIQHLKSVRNNMLGE